MFGIKVLREEVLRLAKEVKQLQCPHHEKDSLFKAEYVWGFLSRSKECGLCGKTIASYISDLEYMKAKSEHLRQEAERLHPAISEAEKQAMSAEKENTYQCNLSGAANPVGNPAGAGPGRSLSTKAERLDIIYKAKWPEVILRAHEERERKRKTFADSFAAQAQQQDIAMAAAKKEYEKRRDQKEKSEFITDGDYIKKIKGRWVHVRSGKVLKVKK